jgi:hypothetical protein
MLLVGLNPVPFSKKWNKTGNFIISCLIISYIKIIKYCRATDKMLSVVTILLSTYSICSACSISQWNNDIKVSELTALSELMALYIYLNTAQVTGINPAHQLNR